MCVRERDRQRDRDLVQILDRMAKRNNLESFSNLWKNTLNKLDGRDKLREPVEVGAAQSSLADETLYVGNVREQRLWVRANYHVYENWENRVRRHRARRAR